MNKMSGGVDEVRAKEWVLLEHCERVGRGPAEIERTASVGTVFIRDSTRAAERAGRAALARNRAQPWFPHYGDPEQDAEELAP